MLAYFFWGGGGVRRVAGSEYHHSPLLGSGGEVIWGTGSGNLGRFGGLFSVAPFDQLVLHGRPTGSMRSGFFLGNRVRQSVRFIRESKLNFGMGMGGVLKVHAHSRGSCRLGSKSNRPVESWLRLVLGNRGEKGQKRRPKNPGQSSQFPPKRLFCCRRLLFRLVEYGGWWGERRKQKIGISINLRVSRREGRPRS